MAEEGLSVKEIAAKRNLASSTIEGHLARGVEKGKIDIAKVMPGNGSKRSAHSWKKTGPPPLEKFTKCTEGNTPMGN
jgi:transposase